MKRYSFRNPDSLIQVSSSASPETVRAELLRVHERMEWGHYRTVSSIDGRRTPRLVLINGWSYVSMWARIAWRATLGRAETQRRIRALRTREDVLRYEGEI